MEQVTGDFFLQLEVFTNNYGSFALIPYITGVLLNIVEKRLFSRKLHSLNERLIGNEYASSLLEDDLYSAESVYASYLRPGRHLTAIEEGEKQMAVSNCDEIAAQLRDFRARKYELLNEEVDTRADHVKHGKYIVGGSFLGAFIGGAVFFLCKTAYKVISEIIK